MEARYGPGLGGDEARVLAPRRPGRELGSGAPAPEDLGEGLVQTDPNPGNFLVTAEGFLVLLDFGATKEYSRDIVEGHRSLVRAARRGDRQALLDEAVAMGFLDAREDAQTQETSLGLIALAALNGTNSKFDFEGPEFTAEASRLSLKLMRELRYIPPPHQLVFLHRKLAGIFALNRKLGAKIDLAEHWERVLNPKPA